MSRPAPAWSTWQPGTPTYSVTVTVDGARRDGYEIHRKAPEQALDAAEDHLRALVAHGVAPPGAYHLEAGGEGRNVELKREGPPACPATA